METLSNTYKIIYDGIRESKITNLTLICNVIYELILFDFNIFRLIKIISLS